MITNWYRLVLGLFTLGVIIGAVVIAVNWDEQEQENVFPETPEAVERELEDGR